MKIKTLTILMMLSVLITNGQNVGIGTNTPNGGAILDLTSNSKALLLPRLTTAQRNAISNPVAGMLIYNIDSNRFEGCTQSFTSAGKYNLLDADTGYTGISYPCCINGYVQYNPTSNFALRKIQLILSNATSNPQTLQINVRDVGSNSILGTASSIVPANTITAIPIDFIFSANINLIQSNSYKISIAADNQNIQWKGTSGSAYASICNTSGLNFGLAFKTFTYVDPGLTDESSDYSGISYPCCVNGYVQYNPSASFALYKIQLLLSNATASPQTLQINFGDFGSNPILGTASAIVPANTATDIPVDFILPTTINLIQFSSYKISIAVNNQNIQWKGTTGSAYTSICNSSGNNLGLAYKTYSPIPPTVSWIKLN
jgi:hypothetical protein